MSAKYLRAAAYSTVHDDACKASHTTQPGDDTMDKHHRRFDRQGRGLSVLGLAYSLLSSTADSLSIRANNTDPFEIYTGPARAHSYFHPRGEKALLILGRPITIHSCYTNRIQSIH